MSSGLLFKEAEHYSQIYGINLQTVIKGMTEISISIFKTRKKKTKNPASFSQGSIPPQTKYIVSKD